MSEDRKAMNRRIHEWVGECIGPSAMVAPYTESWALIKVIERRLEVLGWKIECVTGTARKATVLLVWTCEGENHCSFRAADTLQLAMCESIDDAIRYAARNDPKAEETPSVKEPDVPVSPWQELLGFMRACRVTNSEILDTFSEGIAVLDTKDGRRAITPAMASSLEALFHHPASYWLQREADYRAALVRNAVKEEGSASKQPRPV